MRSAEREKKTGSGAGRQTHGLAGCRRRPLIHQHEQGFNVAIRQVASRLERQHVGRRLPVGRCRADCLERVGAAVCALELCLGFFDRFLIALFHHPERARLRPAQLFSDVAPAVDLPWRSCRIGTDQKVESPGPARIAEPADARASNVVTADPEEQRPNLRQHPVVVLPHDGSLC